MSFFAMLGLLTTLGCGAFIFVVGWVVASVFRTASPSQSWQRAADAILANTRTAFAAVRQTVTSSPKVIRNSLMGALGQADRLMRRQKELRDTGASALRGLQGLNTERAQRDLQAYQRKEAMEGNPRVREQYTQARKALEAQLAHFSALRSKLYQILESMREIQSTVEAMQPRIVRLALHTVDTGSDVAVGESREVLEELDVFIAELESMDAEDSLLDVEAIKREVERDKQRRVESGEIDVSTSWNTSESGTASRP